MKLPTISIIKLIIVWKIITFIIILCAFSTLPFNKDSHDGNFLYPAKEKINIFSSLKTWDAQHYIYLSEKGYQKDESSNWFYPLFPTLIRLVNFITHNSLISGLLISNVASTIGIYLFYRLVFNLFGKDKALLATICLMLFPTAFYFQLIYTESLFFMFTMLLFTFFEKKKYGYAALVAFIMPLVRSVGIFSIAPLFLYILLDHTKTKKIIKIPTFNKPIKISLFVDFIWVVAPLLGLIAYYLYMYFDAGDAFAATGAQRYLIAGYSVEHVFDVVLFVKNIFNIGSFHNFTNSAIDRIFFVMFLIFIPFVYKSVPKGMFVFYLLIGMVPLFGSFMAYTRYILPAFPLYIALSNIAVSKKIYTPFLAFIMLSFAMQIFFLVLHALNYWVS